MPETKHSEEAKEKLKKVELNEKILVIAIALLIIGFIVVNGNLLSATLNNKTPDKAVPTRTIFENDVNQPCIDTVELNGNVFQVEIADDREEQITGLMYRKYLPANYGMLFVFDHAFKYNFWMEHMEFPLDIMFISPEQQVIQVFEAPICEKDPCPTYQPDSAAQFVLEINQGISKSSEFTPGTPVKINLCSGKSFNK